MIELLKRDEEVYLYENGTSTRDVIHIQDVYDAIDMVCCKGDLNQTYNVGSGNPTSIGYIMETAKSYLNSKSPLKSKEPPEFHKTIRVKDF